MVDERMKGGSMDRRDPRVDELVKLSASQGEAMRAICRTMDLMQRHITGDGRAGLSERLALLEARQAQADFWGTIIFRCVAPVVMLLLGLGMVAWVQARL
jgi:hypothetical protein